ncbi:ABC transporter substrate-binding protein, partial [Pseudomonas aeruginosa]
AVAVSYRTLVRQGHPIDRTYRQEVKAVAMLSPHRVRFVLLRSGNPVLIRRLGGLPVLPSHCWKDRDFRATTFTAPLGSGPYR